MEEDRASLEVDIACVGFGPAMGGFLSTLSKSILDSGGNPLLQSNSMPGMPLQVMCYERADDLGFGVSGVVTKGRAIRASFPDLDFSEIPMACTTGQEKVVYLLDPHGVSRRALPLRVADRALRALKFMLPVRNEGFELPYIPPFLRKHNGLLLSIGQFNQWVAGNLMGTGLVQIWPATPVKEPLLDGQKVIGIRLCDQGVDRSGRAAAGYAPGMDIKAALTVIGDGPVGAVGQALDRQLGLPAGHHHRDWAVGMKFVVELPPQCELAEGTVLHTFGYPEPEIFGFLYVHPGRVASLGIFVPSWFDHPARTAYRYLQHWMLHPYLWRHLEGGTLRSWGAKTLQEAGKRGEPFLVGDGFARIGEGSGSTNVLAGAGVDEAWMSGVLLAEGVVQLAREGKPFSKENLEQAYVARRRQSWLEKEARVAEKSRDGFGRNFVWGVLGMALSGFTGGLINVPGVLKRPHERIPTLEEYYHGRISPEEIQEIRQSCFSAGQPLHDLLMNRVGWPEIPFDGKLLVSHQDALLLGGKVQAPDGYADHVEFVHPHLCEACGTKVCVEGCSGQAIMPSPEGGVPQFDREKCVHCGACVWNCAQAHPDDPEHGNIRFSAGAGGLHSAEN
ncbi:MAG: 4Fe-4S ferredoxin [Deltaproteobacteria bacterium]|nr:4Fe-4S ferredoxin [Deltaproteobacteria bacterium]